MKANEVPEQLYIDSREHWMKSWTAFTTKAKGNDIEYIRKDAFIEKTFEFFGEHLCEYIDVKNANCDTFINIDGDKLEDDFRNYMYA